jgi:hypothetical protein
MPTEDLTLIKDAFNAPSEDIAKQILQAAGANPDVLAKTLSTSSGIVAYDLQAPAKNLYPVFTPLRNRIPRVGGGTGTATNWKVITGITGSGNDGMGWVPEGQRSGRMSYSATDKAASYVTIGEEDAVTFEAIGAGRTFEDVKARATMRTLQKMMLKEEVGIFGGNRSIALGTPTTPTLSAAGSTATLPTLTYSVFVVALTLEGYKNASLSGGVVQATSVTGADGQTYTMNGGSSQKSAEATQAVTLGQALSCTVPAITGAVAYAWYVGGSGAAKLEKITTINSAIFTAPLTGTGQAATAVTADCSKNAAMAFDGLLTTALKTGSGAYIKSLAMGTAGTGTALTASGAGSVTEIDDMMQSLYDQYQLSVSVMFVSSQEQRNITRKVLSSGQGSLLNYFQDPKAGEYKLAAGGAVEYYYNPYTNKKIPIIVHPFAAPGTICGWAEDLPIQYQNSETPNIAEMKIRSEYYQIDWPLQTRRREFGVYAEEVLAVYAPFGMGVITNVANG